ncbi:MAG: hypothetical protein IPL61_31275 [Myxococcales bacterium]|nr:hypothetical protein [Myxococcales bacterium]
MIRTLTTRSTLLAALSASLVLGACTDETDHTSAKFSSADAAHLERALDVAAASDLGQLYVVGAFIAGANEPGCPSFVTTGNVTTVTGGCTNDDGTRLEGRIIATNVQGIFTTNPSYDPSKPSTVEAEAWTATDPGAPAESIDGKVTLTNVGGVADNGEVFDGAADAALGGIAAHSEIAFTCDATHLCTHSEDSWVDIDGVGAATLAGTWRLGEPRTGTITATGAETLVLDIGASTDECRMYRIDGGATQMVCDAPDQSARLAPSAGNRWLRSIGR